MDFPIQCPNPNGKWLKQVIKGEIIPNKVPFAELFFDQEIMAGITEEIFGQKWVKLAPDREIRKQYWDNFINVYYRLGYDYVRIPTQLSFPTQFRTAFDTAALSKGNRTWVEEGTGLITSWEDFETYPWPNIENIDFWDYEYISGAIPEGMAVVTNSGMGFLEVPTDVLFGYQNLAFMLADEPELVKAVFEKVGNIMLDYYRNVADTRNLMGFFLGDDMGFKTSTLFSPDMLREYVLPWHKKACALAHEKDLLYILHSCGQLEAILEDLIEDVKIDAKHSYEDVIIPVTEFKKKYGHRIAVIGGVDIDKLCRLPEDDLRNYVRGILDTCMEGGRYALGTGNSVANYIPIKNFMIMLEEGLRWGK